MSEPVDLLVKGWYVVTMNATRDIIHDGAVAVRDGAIVDVGKAADLERQLRRRRARSAATASSSRRAWSTPTSTSPASR